jgi:heme/copper-type cytochrome/quinol oxidase subunit 4
LIAAILQFAIQLFFFMHIREGDGPRYVEGFEQFMKRYTNGLAIERAAIENLK